MSADSPLMSGMSFIAPNLPFVDANIGDVCL